MRAGDRDKSRSGGGGSGDVLHTEKSSEERERERLALVISAIIYWPAGRRHAKESRQHLPLREVHPLHFEKRERRAATEWLIDDDDDDDDDDEDAVAAVASLPTITEPLSLFSVLGVR